MTRTHTNVPSPAPAGAVMPPGWLRLAALAAALAYTLGIAGYLLTHGGWPTPDYLIPPLLLVAVVLGRGPAFLADWGPFLLIILVWQWTAGLADQLGRPVHVRQLLVAEQALFGGAIPTVELQARLYQPNGRWYDWVGVAQHSLHFILPVVVGFWLWLGSRRLYWRYLATVLVLFLLGFLTYALYPAAPPWMAAEFGLTPPIHRIAIETLTRFPAAAPVGLAYKHMSPNAVAALPSLHAALPLAIALSLIRIKGRAALPTLLYPLVMAFFLVYLGEHYVIDTLAGFIYAGLAYLLVWRLPWARLRRSTGLGGFTIPQLRPSPLTRAAGTALMPLLALASMLVIGLSLRPGGSGALIPGLEVVAGEADALDPQPCDLGASSSLVADQLLVPVAERYAAYLIDVDEPACWVLAANPQFPPPSEQQVITVAEGPVALLRPALGEDGEVVLVVLVGGQLTDELVGRGLPAEHRLVLVVTLAGVADEAAATDAVAALAARLFVPSTEP